MTSVVQTKDAAGAGSPTTLNFASSVSVGNSIIVWIGDYNSTSSVISSSAPTYNGSSVAGATKLWEAQNAGTNVMYSACWLLPNVASSGTSVAITTTNANADSNTHYFIAEVAGLGASPAVDTASPDPATANSNGSANPSSGATGNAAGSSGIAIGGNMVDAAHGQTVGGAWTTIGTQSGFYPAAGYQIFTSSGTSYTFSSTLASGQWAAGVVILDVTAAAQPASYQLIPPGRQSPAAWQPFPYPRLGQTITISGSGGVVLPKPTLAGQGAVSPPTVFPAVQPMPPGLSSPAAWQYPRYPRLGQVTTISGSGGVVLPKPSLAGQGTVFTPLARPPLMPPGFLSPAAWQQPAYRRLGQTITISGSGGVVLPKPSLAGSGGVAASVALPPLMPPGALSPGAWQFPRYPRLGQVTTIAGAGGVVLPKPSLSGSGNVTFSVALPAVQLMPPGYLSPAAWQQPAYRRLGQTITISGAGGVVLPKPSLAGSGAVSPPAVFPAVQVMPPGYLSPGAWQAPRYPRLGQVVTIAGAGGVVLPKPSLSGSGLVTVSGIARPPLMPPGLSSPAAWQYPPLRKLGQGAIIAISGTGGVVLPKPSLAPAGTGIYHPRPGSWWGLDSVFKQSRQEFDAYVSRPPVACPNDGEPLINAPATKAGSGVQLYCRYCNWQFPRDWWPPSRPYF